MKHIILFAIVILSIMKTYADTLTYSVILNEGYDQTTGEWCNISKFEKGYNQNNQLVMDVYYEWDFDNNIWKGIYKNQSIYKDSSILIESSTSKWDTETNSWYESSKSKYGSDSLNNNISYEHWEYDEAKHELIQESKFLYTYDENNNKIEDVSYTYDSEKEVFVENSKRVYEYDSLNNKIAEIDFYYNNITQQWIPKSKYSSVHADSLYISSQVEYWNNETEEWKLHWQWESVYDSIGRRIGNSDTYWDTISGKMISRNKLETKYSVSGDSVENAIYHWDTIASEWQGITKYQTIYDSLQRTSFYYQYNWYDQIDNWLYFSMKEIQYSGDTVITYGKKWSPVLDKWNIEYIDTTLKDDSGNRLYWTQYVWNNQKDIAIGEYREQREVNSFGDTIYTFSSWNATTQSWYMLDRSEIEYNDGERIEIKYFRNDETGEWYIGSRETTKKNIEKLETEIQEHTIAIAIEVYPNPASDYIHINASEISQYDVFIYDNRGREIVHVPFDGEGTCTLPVFDLLQGVYYVTVSCNSYMESYPFIIYR